MVPALTHEPGFTHFIGIAVIIHVVVSTPIYSRHSTLEVQRDHFAVVKLTTDPLQFFFSDLKSQSSAGCSISFYTVIGPCRFFLAFTPKESALVEMPTKELTVWYILKQHLVALDHFAEPKNHEVSTEISLSSAPGCRFWVPIEWRRREFHVDPPWSKHLCWLVVGLAVGICCSVVPIFP